MVKLKQFKRTPYYFIKTQNDTTCEWLYAESWGTIHTLGKRIHAS
jgi:hypothetical protein